MKINSRARNNETIKIIDTKGVVVVAIVMAVLLLLLPIILYLMYYHGTWKLSSDIKHWIEFAQYYGLFVSLFSGITLLMLMYLLHIDNQNSMIRIFRAGNEPFIAFTIRRQWPGHTIKNIGNGPALNIDIYYSQKMEGNWDVKYVGLTLGKEEEVWLGKDPGARIAAKYFDSEGRPMEPVYMIGNRLVFDGDEKNTAMALDVEEDEVPLWKIQTFWSINEVKNL